MQTMTATYSPEDNKLRLYSSTRLSKEEYERVKAHGFRWAPKQDCFFAPMWTPDREDLLIELCGEVGDEDTSLVERAEQRAERFQEYRENRTKDAEAARAAVGAIADNIPLGQPILVGHHSEKRARKDAERIENGMRRAVRMWDCAEYWKGRAAGAIRHAKYKERPDVRARRIKGLEADKRRQERHKAEAEDERRFWMGEKKFKRDGEPFVLEITEENRALLHHLLGLMPGGSTRIKHGDHYWSAWDLTRPEEERYKACPQITVAEIKAACLASIQARLDSADRWAQHYENRLAYERALLGEAGGTVADRTGPEVGGGCRCWASPAYGQGWSFIQKVNKVSVTVLRNWGNGGANFTQTIPFDKLRAVMTKAQVEAARENGTLKPTGDGLGFFLTTDFGAPTPTTPKPTEPEPAQAMREALKAGVQVVTANQLFPTPPPVAGRLVELAELANGQRILEPSAGTGNLLDAINSEADLLELVAVEINRGLATALEHGPYGAEVICADFLECNGDLGKFDRVVMNPPFENGADIRHVLHARTFLKPGGKLAAIVANGPRQQRELQPIADHWEALEPGAFAEQGTNVNAAIVVLGRAS